MVHLERQEFDVDEGRLDDRDQKGFSISNCDSELCEERIESGLKQ